MAINVKNILSTGEFKGVLQGYKIEKETVKAPYSKEGQFEKGDNVVQYRGYVSVLTNPETGQFATVNVRNLQNKYNGELDYTSQALEAMANEEVETFAKTKDITKTPTVTIKGVGLSDNFYVKDGEVKESVNVDLGFGRLYLNDAEEEPKFENSVLVNGVVRDIRPEIKNDEETGRALIDIYIPYTYGSEKKGNQVIRAFKTTLVAGVTVDADDEGEYEIDLGADLLECADEVIGDSWKFGIELNNYYEEVEKPKVEVEETERKRFGRKVRETVDTNRKRQSEYLLTGLDQLVTPFDEDDIKDALRMREVAIEEAKKKSEEEGKGASTAKPSRGITRGRTESTSTEGATTSAPARGRGRRFN